MLALTLYPEWAWAITHLDKRIENRSWKPINLKPGDRLAIHSGKALKGGIAALDRIDKMVVMAEQNGWDVEYDPFDGKTKDEWKHPLYFSKTTKYDLQQSHVFSAKQISTSSIVATVQFDGFVFGGPWYVPGSIGWSFSDVVVFTNPIEVKGKPGLWDYPLKSVAG